MQQLRKSVQLLSQAGNKSFIINGLHGLMDQTLAANSANIVHFMRSLLACLVVEALPQLQLSTL